MITDRCLPISTSLSLRKRLNPTPLRSSANQTQRPPSQSHLDKTKPMRSPSTASIKKTVNGSNLFGAELERQKREKSIKTSRETKKENENIQNLQKMPSQFFDRQENYLPKSPVQYFERERIHSPEIILQKTSAHYFERNSSDFNSHMQKMPSQFFERNANLAPDTSGYEKSMFHPQIASIQEKNNNFQNANSHYERNVHISQGKSLQNFYPEKNLGNFHASNVQYKERDASLKTLKQISGKSQSKMSSLNLKTEENLNSSQNIYTKRKQFQLKTEENLEASTSNLNISTNSINKAGFFSNTSWTTLHKSPVLSKNNSIQKERDESVTTLSKSKLNIEDSQTSINRQRSLTKTNSVSYLSDRKSRPKNASINVMDNENNNNRKPVNVKKIDLSKKKLEDEEINLLNRINSYTNGTVKIQSPNSFAEKYQKIQKSTTSEFKIPKRINPFSRVSMATKMKYYRRKNLRKRRNKVRKEIYFLSQKQNKLSQIQRSLFQKNEKVLQLIELTKKENLKLKMIFELLNNYSFKNSLPPDQLPSKLPSYLIPESDFQLNEGKILGKGGFATVYEGFFNSEVVAIKKLIIPLESLKPIINELILMMSISHSSIIQLKAISIGEIVNNSVTIYVLMEKMDSDLRKTIFGEKRYLTKPQKYKILIDILKGLNYLHERNYVHCDLKLQNILLDNSYQAKIADFGLVKSLRSGKTKQTHIAGYSERTSSYEYLCEEKVSTKADIWSFGVLMYEFLREKISWENLNGVQAVAKISLKTPFFNCNQKIGNKVEDGMVEACLNYEHGKRPTAKELIEKIEKNLIKA